MNRCIVTTIAFLTAVLLLNVSDANSDDVNVFSGAHYATIADSKLLSSSMTLYKDGGKFKTLDKPGDLLSLTSGEIFVCTFNLPDNAINVKATIDYYVTSDSSTGGIHLNKVLLTNDNSILKKKSPQGLSTTEIALQNVQSQNEMKFFSVNGEVCIHRIKIDYDYPMSFNEKHNVIVVLTSPVSNIDDIQQNMRLKWRIKKGDCRNGWISIQYQDNGVWKTIPGAELLDCQSKKHGEFIWSNHGLSAIPKFQIEYHDYKKDPLPEYFSREMRPFVLRKTDSLSDFIKLIDRLLDKDSELFATINFTYDNITEFIPTEETKREKFLHYYLKTLASRLVDESVTQSTLNKIAELEEERKKKDLDVEFKLLNLETIGKNLTIFKTLEDGIGYLIQSTQKRIDDLNLYTSNRIEEETSKQKKALEKVRDEIIKVLSNVRAKKKNYISYSVVSPYLADADRALNWKLPNYNKKIDMLCLLYKCKYIDNCSDPVKLQFGKLLMKYSDTYPRIKKLIEEIQASAKRPKLKN